MTPFQWFGAILGALLAVYILARLVTAAFFNSKRDYERISDHGTSKHTRK